MRRPYRPVARSRPWAAHGDPKRILVIRMHAFGDVAITFPACAALRKRLPGTRIDILTSEPMESLVRASGIFDRVFLFPPTTSRARRALQSLRLGRMVRSHHYQIVLDLQNNWVSRTIRSAAKAEAWAEFDRVSPLSAGARTSRTFHRAGFAELTPIHALPIDAEFTQRAGTLLSESGREPGSTLIALNPAGLWASRQWPDDSFRAIANRLLENPVTQIVLVGTQRMRLRSSSIFHGLPASRIVNLIGRTSAGEALALLPHVSAVVSEDSGLMHMAWACGIPTVALLGSTRHDWSAPDGNHTYCFHSGDLHCGSCMEPLCRFGDTVCLTRVTPELVHEQLLRLSPTLAEAS